MKSRWLRDIVGRRGRIGRYVDAFCMTHGIKDSTAENGGIGGFKLAKDGVYGAVINA